MDTAQILERLANVGLLPVDAIHAARLDRTALIPEFIAILDAAADGSFDLQARPDLPFFAFHLLGEWREKSACPTLIRFLRSPAAESLGDGLCLTAARVITEVFDGDPEPLHALILDRAAHEGLRATMFDAIALMARERTISLEGTVDFLRACFTTLQVETAGFIWFGWQRAISLLSLSQLLPVVKEACDRGFVDPGLIRFRDFERDFRFVVDNPGRLSDDHRPFEDVIEEFSSWYGFSEVTVNKRRQAYGPPPATDHWVVHTLNDEEQATLSRMTPAERELFLARLERALNGQEPARELPAPAVNPHRDIGRNDPCPCGSGRKFKRCCLAQAA
jgi:hypothetical protein